jgi:hypothetical protein
MDLTKLEQHPLCARVNDMHPLTRIGVDTDITDAAEAGALLSSVARFGPRRRVVIDADTGQVLDGWNFLQAYLKAQDAQRGALEPLDSLIEIREFATETDKAAFVLGLQIGRRNLSTRQRAALAKDFLQLRDGTESAPSIKSVTEISGASRTTTLRLNRIDREGAPELAAGIRSGAVPMESAEALLSKSKAEQAAIIAAGPQAVAEVRREAVDARAARRGRETSVPWSREATQADLDRLKARDDAREAARRGPAEAADAFFDDGAGGGATQAQDVPVASSGASSADIPLEAALAIAKWWNTPGRTAEERGNLLYKARWQEPYEAGRYAALPAERRAHVLRHSAEIRADLRDSLARANGVKIDKMETIRSVSKLRRDMPRNGDVMGVCQTLEAALLYVP